MALDQLKLAILISGRGSNMISLLDACENADFPATTVVVVSNKPDAAGIIKAKSRGVETVVLDDLQFPDRQAFETALHDVLVVHDPDLVCLAGFMRVLSAGFVAKWEGKIINIHPSLLPLYKGLNTHARALEAGDVESGCTVHYVTAELDAGPVILQKRVVIEDDDTVDSLAQRVLKQEHVAYPEAILKIWSQREDMTKEEIQYNLNGTV